MILELVDDEHGHDEDGRLWVRGPERWRRADGVEPSGAPLVEIRDALGRWSPLPADDYTLEGEGELIWLVVHGERWVWPWRMLVETPRGHQYIQAIGL